MTWLTRLRRSCCYTADIQSKRLPLFSFNEKKMDLCIECATAHSQAKPQTLQEVLHAMRQENYSALLADTKHGFAARIFRAHLTARDKVCS